MFIGPSGLLAVTGAETVGLPAVGEVMGGLLTVVLGEPVNCFPVDLVLLLSLAA